MAVGWEIEAETDDMETRERLGELEREEGTDVGHDINIRCDCWLLELPVIRIFKTSGGCIGYL